MTWFTSFLYSQFFVSLPVPSKDFSGQTIIVTGSNTGLGLEAAKHLSRLNADLLILAVRDTSKGERAKSSILEETGKAAFSIEVWPLDLQSTESIQSFAARASRLARIDGLLENAGIQTRHFKLVEGYESTIMTNVIGTFLLALLVLPKMRETAVTFNTQPRLSIVSSDLHFLASFVEQDSEDMFKALSDTNFDMGLGMERYSVSKLLQVLIVRELGTFTPVNSQPTVIINCLTPGACMSDFDRESSGWQKVLVGSIKRLFSRSTEVGSRTLISGLVAGNDSHGAYMADCKVASVSSFVTSVKGQHVQKRVWTELLDQLDSIHPGIALEAFQ